ncbi:hypothetical protein B7486_56250, partial [cyanobacterium TDX16]
MMNGRLDDLVAGATVVGIDPAGPVEVVAVKWSGTQAVTLTYRDQAAQVQEQMVFRADEGTFSVVEGTKRAW